MLLFLAKGFGGGAAMSALEEKLVKPAFPQLYEKSVLGLPKLYGGVIVANVIVTTFTLMKLGFKVGKARAEYKVDLPKMYAEGNDDNARKFNCVQRGHQQALETYTSFLALGLIAGIRHPLTALLNGLFWAYARVKWAEGYATGDPKARYDSFFSTGIWYSFLALMSASTSTALLIAGVA
eukprot:Hpha_TRINITY_DN14973_c1_g11::TRINITY_DN14973_c1_g11_i1::g.144683::m.144683/K00799/GST, gst; glutathione S-transferase